MRQFHTAFAAGVMAMLSVLHGCSPRVAADGSKTSGSPAVVKSSTPPGPRVPSGYTLVWQDEFNVDGPVNAADWVCEEGLLRNREDQYYQAANANCEGGVLVLEARRERIPNPRYRAGAKDYPFSREFAEYTSASVRTKGKHEWIYGRFEMRGRIDIRQGCWPAFWTLGTARQWPACGEIDIMEYFQGHVKANVQWASPKPASALLDAVSVPVGDVAKQAGYASAEAWAADFHVWRMDWDHDRIRLYLDDRLMNETDLSKTVNQTVDGANPLREPQHILLNLAIGGSAGGDPSATEFPAKFEVDWVRIYQKTGSPTGSTLGGDSGKNVGVGSGAVR